MRDVMMYDDDSDNDLVVHGDSMKRTSIRLNPLNVHNHKGGTFIAYMRDSAVA